MSLEEALRENTAAVLAHTAFLQKMVDQKAGGAAAEDKPARVRRTNAQIEADKAAEAAKDKPVEDRPRRERASRDDTKAGDEVADFRNMLGKFLDFGKEGNADDDKERAYRADFIEDMNKHFKVDAAREIDPKNFKKVARWIKLVEDQKEVDFDND